MNSSLIDRFIEEQQALTAVEKFAAANVPHNAPRYRELLPITPPASGEQYAFEVDLDKCSGCKACVTACHALNGLDDDEAWRETGTLTSTDWREAYQQTITTACHHCVDPGCLNGCPVLAYEKDPVTGIVRHLDDQCIGCQYCIWKCPYEVPQYSRTRGIVRKCDMCSSRLAVGEAPACVQACPNEAIRITLVRASDLITAYRDSAEPTSFLPASPNPEITLPSTRYLSRRVLPVSISAADEVAFRKQKPNLSLVTLLVFSQLALGTFTVNTAIGVGNSRKVSSVLGLASLVIALAASVMHLGRPFGAWRVFLGLRKSWLSREAIGLICFLAASAFMARGIRSGSLSVPLWETVTLLTGLIALFCSAMVYHDTARDFWKLSYTGPKFLGTTLLLGCSAVLLIGGAVGLPASSLAVLSLASMVFTFGKLGIENRLFHHVSASDLSPLFKTALAHRFIFGMQHRVRIACALAGGVFLPALVLVDTQSSAGFTPGSSLRLGWFTSAGFVLCLLGELIERWLFFVAVQPRKMPGNLV